jgi:hypothetical protein
MILLNLPHCNHSLVLVLHHFINLMTPPINLGTGLKLCLIFRTSSKILFFEQLDLELEPALIFFQNRNWRFIIKVKNRPTLVHPSRFSPVLQSLFNSLIKLGALGIHDNILTKQ